MKEYKLKCYDGRNPRILVTEEIVTRNNFTLNRTREEILEKLGVDDFFGNKTAVFMDYLDFEDVKKFYKQEYVEKIEKGEVEKPQGITDIYETVQDMLDYLIFGYDKALDERGLSAGRTIEKLSAWLWLLGRDDLRRLISDDELYNPYGMPALIALTESLGFAVPEECREFAKNKC